MILNSLGLSGLVFLGTVYQIPSVIVTRINKLAFNFLWSNKTELVKRDVIFQPREKGGLGLCNIVWKNQALMLGSIGKITDKEAKSKWIFLARY